MKNEDKLYFTLTVIAAILGALGVPSELAPMGIAPFGLISHIPLIIVLAQVKTIRKLLLHVVVYTVILIPMMLYWLAFFKDYSIYTVGGVIVGMIGYFSLWFPIMWFILRSSPRAYRFLLFGAVWTVYEYWKSTGFLGFPWGLIAYPLHQNLVLFQSAEWFGIYFLTFILASSQAWVAEWFLPARSPFVLQKTALMKDGSRDLWQSGAVLAGLWAFNILFGLVTYYYEKPTDEMTPLDVVLVQVNIDPWKPGSRVSAIETSMDLTEKQIPNPQDSPDLIVWSELSLYFAFDPDRDWTQTYRQIPQGLSLPEFVRIYDSQYVLGGLYLDFDDELYARTGDRRQATKALQNSTIILDNQANWLGHYAKNQMVPFVEDVPFYYNPILKPIYQAIGLPGSYSPGDGIKLFSVTNNEGIRINYGTPICFEDAFSWIGRHMAYQGADLLINLTNNSWSQTDSAQWQHYIAAFLRAIETRRPLIRSSLSGMTGIVDTKGNISVQELPFFTEDSLRASIWVDPGAPITAYTRWGDLLVYILILFCFLPAINYWYWRSKKGIVSLV
jgi:apolipoprotein N-acyltransferase